MTFLALCLDPAELVWYGLSMEIKWRKFEVLAELDEEVKKLVPPELRIDAGKARIAYALRAFIRYAEADKAGETGA